MTSRLSETEREYWKRINAVIDYIRENLDKDFSLDELAGVAAFSKFHFHRIFKAIAGETVHDFIRRTRLEWAANLLCYNTHEPVSEIAFKTGFSSQANFAKAFKKHFGVSPSEFRTPEHLRKIGKLYSNEGKAQDYPVGEIASEQRAQLGTEIEPARSAEMSTESKELNIEVTECPERHVAYIRHIGPYDDPGVSNAWERLCGWAGPRMLLGPNTEMIGISHDNPMVTPAENLRYDACITVPENTGVEGDIGKQKIPGGTYAIYHAIIENMDFQSAWNDLAGRWLPGSGYQPDDKPAFEKYLNEGNKDPEKKWIVDLYMPVKPL